MTASRGQREGGASIAIRIRAPEFINREERNRFGQPALIFRMRAVGLSQPLLAGGGEGKRIGAAIFRIDRALNQTFLDQFGNK